MITRFLGLVLTLLSLCSCGHIYTNKDTYRAGAAVELNGAMVRSAVLPEGSSGPSLSVSAMIYTAGRAKLVGPFAWRIEAEGKKGVHEKMAVYRIKVSTEKTKREEWFPKKHLGNWIDFESLSDEEGKSFAAYRLPGLLKIDPEKDGAFTIIADVSVKSKLNTERKLIKFSMARSEEKDVDFIFIPAEIAKGWKVSPREWKSQESDILLVP